MKTRIYLATDRFPVDPDQDLRLIRAKNKAQVRSHILQGYKIEVASQDDLINYAMEGSTPIEDATAVEEETND